MDVVIIGAGELEEERALKQIGFLRIHRSSLVAGPTGLGAAKRLDQLVSATKSAMLAQI